MKNDNDVITVDPEDIILTPEIEEKKNKFFEKFKKTDPKELNFDKISKMNIGPIKKVWDGVLSLWQVVSSNKIPMSAKVTAIGALVYLISPIDAIPDMIPIAGLTDDVAVITFALTQLAGVIKTLNKDKKRGCKEITDPVKSYPVDK